MRLHIHLVFRFQTGAIKRCIMMKTALIICQFRFQTGAIKRKQQSVLLQAAIYGFDSKLVRLKVSATNAFLNRVELFRFQTGAIKSDSRAVQLGLGRVGFDSKLVRLKELIYLGKCILN